MRRALCHNERLQAGTLRILLAVAFLLTLSCHSQHPSDSRLLSVRQIRALPQAALQGGLPVSLEGIVSCLDNRSHLLVIQDGTGGISIEQRAPLADIAAGDRVSIQGFTAWEAFSPVIVKPKVIRLGLGTLPPCVEVNPVQVFQSEFQARRIELTCEAVSVSASDSRGFELEAKAGQRMVRICGLFAVRTPLVNIPGRQIRVRGVSIPTYTPKGEIHSLSIYTSLDDDIQVRTEILPKTPLPAEERNSRPHALISDVWSVKSMSNQEAAQHLPVRLQGVVTQYYNSNMTLQDASAAIFVVPIKPGIPGLSRGSKVEIEGHTADGFFAPVIRPDFIRILGKAPLPKPITPHPEEGFSGWEENRWAEMVGIIHQPSVDFSNRNKLLLAMGKTRIQVMFLKAPSRQELEHLVDCEVRVRGVYAPLFSVDQRLLGFALRTPDISYLEVLEKPLQRGFDKQTRPIHSLTEYSHQGLPVHQVKISGRITHMGSDGAIFLSDESGGIRVYPVRECEFHLGDAVEAIGFIGTSPIKPSLQSAVLRETRATVIEKSQPAPVDAALTGIYDGQVIQVEGFLRERSLSFGNQVFSMESGRTRFMAVLEHPQGFPLLEQLRPNALLRLTGVCDTQWDTSRTPPLPTDVRILLRTPADITLLRKAPWWTLPRAVGLMASLGVVLLAAAAWLVRLQHKVIQRTKELKAHALHREAVEEQLQQSQKLEGVGRLAGGVAHDFNNLLTIINGYCDLLINELPEADELRGCASEMRKAGERAATLTRQLLAFSRKQILKPMVVDLNDLVVEMDQMLGRLIPANIELTIHPCKEPCLVKVDSGQISQVLMNLVVNARDALPEGGRILIETHRTLLTPDHVAHHPEVAPDTYAELVVADSGIGMDEATLRQVFEPFFTTKKLGKGTGLGLSTVFGIVKQSGGQIWASSEPGQGTRFQLFFPTTAEEPVYERHAPQVAAIGHGVMILVVEDENEVRTLVARSLEEQGFQVMTAQDPQDAISIADDFPQPIHLLLTDVVMPEMNGRDLAKTIQRRHPAIKVLFMSGYTEDVIASKGTLEEGIEFIQKPFDTKELVRRVLAVIQKN